MSVSLDKENSKVLVAFTKGDWKAIEDRMGMIESGEFFNRISPSFSYGLGLLNNVKALLDYAGSMGMGSGLVLNKGTHNLIIEYDRVENGRPVINIRRA
jgi:hypothetical protein